ncbi:hypothetical protein FKM82_010660, partial [Ascaphus truei]
MVKGGSKSKQKKKTKLQEEAINLCEAQSNAVIPVPENYIAGEVAGSLFSKNSSERATPLLSLFDTKGPAVQPVYVPVVITKKRKLPEVDGAKSGKTACSINQATAKKIKLAKELSVAEKKLAARESALTNADEEENTRNILLKQKLKNKKTESLEDEAVIEQHRRKKVNKAEERIKNKRTVFVGNLPADYTKP